MNVLGLCTCTREAVKIMKEHGIDGHVVHINSIAGHYVPQLSKPVLNVYPASKYAVTALTETLMHELRSQGSKIKVTVRKTFLISKFLAKISTLAKKFIYTFL